MNDKLAQALENLEAHADALMNIPASKQHIRNIQAVVSIALLEVKRAFEALDKTPDQEIQSR